MESLHFLQWPEPYSHMCDLISLSKRVNTDFEQEMN